MNDARPAFPVSDIKCTPLHGLHVANGARMVSFAGYELPLNFPAGVLKEHLATLTSAGLFDVSHMGQLTVRPRSGRIADAARALERLVPADILGLAPGRQRYTVFTNDSGGILDDLMIAHCGDYFLLVVNASCKAADLAHLQANIENTCVIEMLDRALVAVQGPSAEAVLARHAPASRDMRFMDVRVLDIQGAPCFVTRSGYTGEDGFEISIPTDLAQPIAEALLGDPALQQIGLGARDSLRLEAGLSLYGAELDEMTTPIEASLAWTIPAARRAGGARKGCFPGAPIILDQLASGTERCRVVLVAEGRAPVRAGADIYLLDDTQRAIGIVTSGGFGPTVDRPVAMGYLPPAFAKPGARVYAEVRGKRLPMVVAPLPFVPPKVKRT